MRNLRNVWNRSRRCGEADFASLNVIAVLGHPAILKIQNISAAREIFFKVPEVPNAFLIERPDDDVGEAPAMIGSPELSDNETAPRSRKLEKNS